MISGQCPGVSVIRDIVTDVTRIINTNTGSLRRKTTLNLETNTEKQLWPIGFQLREYKQIF